MHSYHLLVLLIIRAFIELRYTNEYINTSYIHANSCKYEIYEDIAAGIDDNDATSLPSRPITLPSHTSLAGVRVGIPKACFTIIW